MKKTRVLLVDDDEDVRELFGDVLKRLGCDVVEAKDGEDGLIKFGNGRFDLIITDNDMPKIGGFEFIKRIKSICDVPIAMITGGIINKETALSGGADFFFEKPVNLGEIEIFVLQAEVRQIAAG